MKALEFHKLLRNRGLMRITESKVSTKKERVIVIGTVRSGHWKKPDPVNQEYEHKRKLSIFDTNTMFYHDYNPEYMMHYHSNYLEYPKGAYVYFTFYCLLFGIPLLVFLFTTVKRLKGFFRFSSGATPTGEYDHMGYKLVNFVKDKNYEDCPDFLGRRSATYYKNWIRPDFENPPEIIISMRKYGYDV